jgi:hypothetical protein
MDLGARNRSPKREPARRVVSDLIEFGEVFDVDYQVGFFSTPPQLPKQIRATG